MIEIYFQDLTKEKQKEILDALGENGNYDTFPIATIETNEENNKDGSKVDMNDLVEITCYNSKKTMIRGEAIKFYTEGADCSDGFERQRYLVILQGLYEGKTKISDQD